MRHYTASGVVLNGGRVLLVHHARIGLWMFPGGHVEADEDPPQTLRREIREETGLEVGIISAPRREHPAVTMLASPFTILVEDVPDPKDGLHQHLDMIYVCHAPGRELSLDPAELKDCRWVRPEQIAEFQTPPQIPGVAAEAFDYARRHGPAAATEESGT